MAGTIVAPCSVGVAAVVGGQRIAEVAAVVATVAATGAVVVEPAAAAASAARIEDDCSPLSDVGTSLLLLYAVQLMTCNGQSGDERDVEAPLQGLSRVHAVW